MTLRTLEQSWWWKVEPLEKIFPKTNPIQDHFLHIYWKDGGEAAAFAYELVRRSNRKLKLKPYPKLSLHEGFLLLETFGAGKSRVEWCQKHKLKNISFEDGFSSPAIWKLDVPITTLQKVFVRFIEAERKHFGVKPRKQIGETSKRPVWDWCSTLDKLDLLKERPSGNIGSDPERGVRRIRERARKESKKFFSALKQKIQAFPNMRKFLWPEIPDRLLLTVTRLLTVSSE